jgi:hypothetical protein
VPRAANACGGLRFASNKLTALLPPGFGGRGFAESYSTGSRRAHRAERRAPSAAGCAGRGGGEGSSLDGGPGLRCASSGLRVARDAPVTATSPVRGLCLDGGAESRILAGAVRYRAARPRGRRGGCATGGPAAGRGNAMATPPAASRTSGRTSPRLCRSGTPRGRGRRPSCRRSCGG